MTPAIREPRKSRARIVGAALICVAMSAIMLSPFMNLAHISSALHTGDGRLYAWILAWVAHAITNGLAVFEANMFFPAHTALAQTDHFFALGVVGAPLWIATGNSVLVFNVLQLLGPAITSFTAFLLFQACTADWLASLIGGLLFGLSFFALLHNAHLGLTWAAGLPLALLFFERWWLQPTWPTLAALWAVCVFTALTSWYLAVMLVILLSVRSVAMIARGTRTDLSTRLPQVFAGAMLGVAVLLPFASPYLGRTNAPGEAAALAADVRSYVVPPEHTMLGRWLVGRGFAEAQSIWGERTLFLGWTTIGLACLGLVGSLRSQTLERRSHARFLFALLIVAAGLSFGPSSTGLAPFDLLAHLPGFGGFRASARFALLVGFAVSGLAVFGLMRMRRVVPRAASLLIVGLAIVMMAERFVVDFPAGRPRPEAMPEVYALARADGARAAIALPMYAGEAGWFKETDYLLYSTTADFLPLANGYGRWAPDEYLALSEAMRTFPSSSSTAALRFYGITHVILHGARFGDAAPALLSQVRQSTDYGVVAERGADVLLSVTPR